MLVPERVPNVAFIVDVPDAKPVAMPAAGKIVAVAVVPEVQLIAPGTGCVVPSLSNSTAVKSAVAPTMIVGFAGETLRDTGTTAPPTARTTPGETTAPKVAVMVLPPLLTPVASPVALIVATAGVPEFQVT